ncbi:HET-domain-containing protein [Xylariomycetidae sp. FL0641]|nr:HET-domain-containing protein [Xylariomycetidae sp. FL0641]
MRLVNVKTLNLEEYHGDRIPPYAILSHTWREEEANFKGWQQGIRSRKTAGNRKIQEACRLARNDRFQYLWCDTSCIDKSSSVELSEAINSMFAWYRRAAICYAYLDDIDGEDEGATSLRLCRYWKRGWTLQELLAPRKMTFFDKKWQPLGSRTDLGSVISSITGIPRQCLVYPNEVFGASIAQRMSWLSKRQTTRLEDKAYCMLGIFDLNMPLLYGEGSKAFVRLQEELIRVSNDHTIFCWDWLGEYVPVQWCSMLAPSPEVYEFAGVWQPCGSQAGEISKFSMTNSGLAIELPCIEAAIFDFVLLNAWSTKAPHRRAAIPLQQINDASGNWERKDTPSSPMSIDDTRVATERKLYHVRSRLVPKLFPLRVDMGHRRGLVLLTFDRRDIVQPRRFLELRGRWDPWRSIFLLDAVDSMTSQGILGFYVARPGSGKIVRWMTHFFLIEHRADGDDIFRYALIPQKPSWDNEGWYWRRGGCLSFGKKYRAETSMVKPLTDKLTLPGSPKVVVTRLDASSASKNMPHIHLTIG